MNPWEKRWFQFAIMWGVLDHEAISMLHLACMAVILSGVYLISLGSRKRRVSVGELKS